MRAQKNDSFHFSRKIEGVATLGSLKAKVLKGNVLRNDPVLKATYNTFKKVTLETTLEKLSRILDKEHFALVVHSQRLCKQILQFYGSNNFTGTFFTISDVSQSQVQHKEVIVGIVTDIDLLHHVSQKEARSESSSGAQTPNNELEDEN